MPTLLSLIVVLNLNTLNIHKEEYKNELQLVCKGIPQLGLKDEKIIQVLLNTISNNDESL